MYYSSPISTFIFMLVNRYSIFNTLAIPMVQASASNQINFKYHHLMDDSWGPSIFYLSIWAS